MKIISFQLYKNHNLDRITINIKIIDRLTVHCIPSSTHIKRDIFNFEYRHVGVPDLQRPNPRVYHNMSVIFDAHAEPRESIVYFQITRRLCKLVLIEMCGFWSNFGGFGR